MTDVWDFSDLLNNWGQSAEQSAEPTEEENELNEQMQKEIEAIASQIALLDHSDPTILENNNLLFPPKPQSAVSSVREQEKTIQASTSIPKIVAQETTPRSVKKPKIITPRTKEPMRTGPKKFTPVAVSRTISKPKPIFKATPDVLKVVNFQLSMEYTLTFSIQNISSKSNGFQIRSPTDTAFTVRILDKMTTSTVRPGLSINFEVTFIPTEPRDYEGSILIIPGEDIPPTAITIMCYRDPPQLEIPDVVSLGATLVHSLKTGSFTIRNTGGVAFFSFHSATGRDDNMMYTDGAFTLIPSQFQLERGESKQIAVRFRPTAAGSHSASFEIVSQHFPQKFFCMATGEAAIPELKFAIAPEDTHLFLPFLPQDANTTRSVEIRNMADVAYPFHIQILKPRDSARNQLALLYPETDAATVKCPTPPFTVSPASGMIGARDSVTLNVTFSPKMFAFYKANLVLFANRIPDETGTLCSRKMLTIAVEGATGPPSVAIQPPLILFNGVIPCTPARRSIDVVNESNLDIKLQWRKNEIMAPSPLVFDVRPGERAPVELTCVLTKRAGVITKAPFAKKTQHQLAVICTGSSDDGSSMPTSSQNVRPPSSQNYSISMAPLAFESAPTSESATPAAPETSANDEEADEMPNIFGLRHWASAVEPVESGLSLPAVGQQALAEGASKDTDEISLQIDSFTQMNFSYATQVAPPHVAIEPPVLDFGSVLTGTVAERVIRLVNDKPCAIQYVVRMPECPAYEIPEPTGVVEGNSSVEVTFRLRFDEQNAFSDMLTMTTAWVDPSGKLIESMPTATFYVPVYAVFDCPIVSVSNRIINFGEVYPTLNYNSSIEVALLNQFPTDFTVECESEDVDFNGTPVRQSVVATPSEGNLSTGDRVTVGITATYAKLGKQAVVFKCGIIGRKYTCAAVANVVAPRINLVTKKIDFSSDFVICNRSSSFIEVTNECSVLSTVRIEMVDNCNGVFSLDDDTLKQLGPYESVKIPVSCYSEIHGDYYGSVRMIVEDLWQHEETEIPLHVKALGSFFGFEKHTLGYTQGEGGDFVSFGVPVKVGSKPLIRRLSLVNFSSEAISVEWSLANFVHGRHYADLAIDVREDGGIDLKIDEAECANEQKPFSIDLHQTTIASHGKTVVVITLDPSEAGEFSGCVAARSGEFIHTLGLKATVYDE